MKFLEFFLLCPVVSLDLLLELELFIEHTVFRLNNVHLHHSACCFLLSTNDLNLASVIFEFGYNVDEHIF